LSSGVVEGQVREVIGVVRQLIESNNKLWVAVRELRGRVAVLEAGVRVEVPKRDLTVEAVV
jgi:hypothetical protein